MPHREANLTLRVRLPQGWRYLPVAYSANGRVRPNTAIFGGQEQRFVDGRYCLEWRENGRRVRVTLGTDPADANSRLLRKEAELNARNAGVMVVSEDSRKPRITLTGAIADFLDEKRLQRKRKTHVDYESSLRYFAQSCTKTYLDELTRKDLLAFSVYCRDELELSPRTVFNKFARVVAFLRAYKIKLHENGDAPRFVETEPEVYEREELDRFFAACEPNERLWFEFFLMTGMREQEVMHAYWSDVNFAAHTVRVTHKPAFGWTPKAYKEREIPVPAKLAKALKAAKAKANGCPLLFPTAGCKPKMDFLDNCKRIAKAAGLDSGEFWLHKFRATFATWHLWAGVDLRTVQAWLGHSDLESTMRYLKPSRSRAVREKVNQTFA